MKHNITLLAHDIVHRIRNSMGDSVLNQCDTVAGMLKSDLPQPLAFPNEDVLHEAYRLTNGERQNAYGPPDQDFRRTAAMWTALKGVEFTARDVAMFMICLKLSRETHQRSRDNAVDVAGYARCLHICNEAEKKP